MIFLTEENIEINTADPNAEFYSVNHKLEINHKLWCKGCRHFITLEAAKEYVRKFKSGMFDWDGDEEKYVPV